MDLNQDIINQLKDTSEKLLLGKKILSDEELNQGYILFSKKFGIDILKSLDGELLIETIFNSSNKESLMYWLEYKNDDEFKTNSYSYGGIAGGSAFKYIMYKRKLDNKWVTGHPLKPVLLSTDKAIELGKKLRDSLVVGAKLVGKLSENATIEDYIKLQEELSEELINNMHSRGWVHKYYHMLYAKKIGAYHAVKWQRHALICCNIKPQHENKLYIMEWQLIQIAKQLNLPTSQLMNSMFELFGAPINYYRISTSDDSRSYWDEMKNGGYISIGWANIGDLRDYEKQGKSDIKDEIKKRLTKGYTNNPNEISKIANIISSYKNVNIGDVIVAFEDEKVAGVGEILGSYEYREGLDFPHVIKTDWINIKEECLPNSSEGFDTAVYAYKDAENIIAIRGLMDGGIVPPEKLLKLTGIATEIDSVLSRKKQVILYGPPGTGKTYHAEKVCCELASRNLLNKSFLSLTNEEKKLILGDDRKNGIVRICCFHPSYGYEDFIEGIKPRVVNNQTVFECRDGIFKKICSDAVNEPEKDFYLIIDEINRGDISRIFGELIMLIESGKRRKEIILPLSNTLFNVPENVYVVGTMNTADRSIALLDVALRRRFGFLELMPDYTLFDDVEFGGLPLGGWLKGLNLRICEHIGKEARNLQIGHSYFLEKGKSIVSNEKFKRIIKEDIIPLIEEYCYSDYQLIAKILGEGMVDVKNQIIRLELFHSSDISNLVTALLSPFPTLRLETVTMDEENEEHENNCVGMES